MSLLPTKKQWNGWSLPSKLTAISAYIGIPATIIGILIALIPSDKINIEELSKAVVEKMPEQKLIIDKEQKIQTLKATLKRMQENSDDKLKQSALKALDRGDKLKAIELMEKSARTRTEKAAQDWVDIGNVAYFYDTQKAMDAYQKANELDHSNPGAWNGLGIVLADSGKNEEAIEKFERATINKANYVHAWNNWGMILDRNGRHKEAIEKFKQAIKHQLDHAPAFNSWGLALMRMDKNEEAIEKYKEAIKHKPDYASAWNNWGVSLEKLGKLEKAIEKYKKALGHQPNYAIAWNNWGAL